MFGAVSAVNHSERWEALMPKTQILSAKIRQSSGHFSQATMIEARGRLVLISGMTPVARTALLPVSATLKRRRDRSAKTSSPR